MCHGFMTHPLFFLHRILRMNQSQYCLSDYSRIFADIWPLANGSRQICAAIVFGHADFADDADFSSWEGFVPQISQIYTDFSSWDYFCHADFADDADFSSWGLFRPTDFTDIHRFFFVGHIPIPGGICADRIGRLRENPCVIASSGKPPNKFRVIR